MESEAMTLRMTTCPLGPGTAMSQLSFVFVPVITGLACFVCFFLMLYGVWAGNGHSVEDVIVKSK